ncbi:ATP synthase F1 subunit delta [Arundinibacter roseus]|uniref:ATP synthase subunit delta n=1 Tax=Arundinibacter roseus TaxID=2070510 RepID=A0A4V2X9U5_9BACT|nr:ATP synthase F1 subunit delta [Arundinibacter roseus]TDB65145.1 ATP synthase F1 subunit delta [Arundinibacter roseus]
MSIGTVASRYAKSLIELAQEKKVVEEVYQDMVLFKSVATQNRGVMLALSSPVIRHEKKLGILKAIFQDKVNPVSYTIFTIITKKNREAILESIADEFVKQYNLLKGIQKAVVTTSIPLDAALRAQFNAMVNKMTGMTVELEEKVDEKLIGGYILRVQDQQIDASLKSRLNNLKLELLN